MESCDSVLGGVVEVGGDRELSRVEIKEEIVKVEESSPFDVVS